MIFDKRMPLFICGALALYTSSAIIPLNQALAQDDDRTANHGIIIERISKTDHPLDSVIEYLDAARIDTIELNHAGALKQFYIMRGFAPYWLDGTNPNENAEIFLRELQNAWTHGLNPSQYNADALTDLYDAIDGWSADSEDAKAFEILMSESYARYAQDLSGFRVNPKFMKSDRKFWKQQASAPVVLAYLNQYDDIDDALKRKVQPQGETYNTLRQDLIALYKNYEDADESYAPLSMQGALHLYDEHAVVPSLRRRLDPTSKNISMVYDTALQEKVIAFQAQNGMASDGVVGVKTLAVLNKSPLQKVYQIIANLERLRWVRHEDPDRFILVNIPSAMLWAVEDGDIIFDMPVVIGREKRATNIFSTEITGLRLNPTWTVPPTIKRDDILPKLIEDPGYLTDKGMALIYGRGKDAITLDPTMIDWSQMTTKDLQSVRMVQNPGDTNPLGSYRVLMPNNYNIYLHDSNESNNFTGDTGRDLSSGCIRMKDPLTVAEFILDGKKGWGRKKIQSVVKDGELQDVFIRDLIPVYLMYYTAWVDGAGGVVYGNDVYDYDSMLIKKLAELDEIVIPAHN